MSTEHSALIPLIIDLLSNGYGVRFGAPGRSMYPTIREGEIITVQPVELANVKPGDILLYQMGKRVIAHRLVSIANSALITQHSALSSDHSEFSTQHSSLSFLFRGDASSIFDDPVAAHQVLGKVVSVEHLGVETVVLIDCGAAQVSALLGAHPQVRAGEDVRFTVRQGAAIYFDHAGNRIGQAAAQ